MWTGRAALLPSRAMPKTKEPRRLTDAELDELLLDLGEMVVPNEEDLEKIRALADEVREHRKTAARVTQIREVVERSLR